MSMIRTMARSRSPFSVWTLMLCTRRWSSPGASGRTPLNSLTFGRRTPSTGFSLHAPFSIASR